LLLQRLTKQAALCAAFFVGVARGQWRAAEPVALGIHGQTRTVFVDRANRIVIAEVSSKRQSD
jgi:ABC-type amino acid transport system permease subunit